MVAHVRFTVNRSRPRRGDSCLSTTVAHWHCSRLPKSDSLQEPRRGSHIRFPYAPWTYVRISQVGCKESGSVSVSMLNASEQETTKETKCPCPLSCLRCPRVQVTTISNGHTTRLLPTLHKLPRQAQNDSRQIPLPSTRGGAVEAPRANIQAPLRPVIQRRSSALIGTNQGRTCPRAREIPATRGGNPATCS
jgi:hypothetical protein